LAGNSRLFNVLLTIKWNFFVLYLPGEMDKKHIGYFFYDDISDVISRDCGFPNALQLYRKRTGKSLFFTRNLRR
jgi:hypothetical protein